MLFKNMAWTSWIAHIDDMDDKINDNIVQFIYCRLELIKKLNSCLFHQSLQNHLHVFYPQLHLICKFLPQ